MRRWKRWPAIGVAVAIAACAPAPPPSPSAEPAPPAAVEALDLRLAWQPVRGLPADPGSRVTAVAASGQGFVAVGVHDRGPGTDGVILTSRDGLDWQAVPRPALSGLWFVDVAAAGDTVVAVGTRQAGDTSVQAMLVAPAGGGWRPVDATMLGARAGSIDWITAGPGGWLAGGQDFDGVGQRRWRSLDGQDWISIEPPPPPIGRPRPTPFGWLASGADGDRGVVWASADGLAWTAHRLPWPADDPQQPIVSTLVAATSRGAIATAQIAAPCPPGASCAADTAMFWSRDGRSWQVVGDEQFGGRVPDGVTVVDDVMVATTFDGLFASRDGWHWERVLERPGGDAGFMALAGRDGTIVVVGETWAGDRTRVSISTAVPAG